MTGQGTWRDTQFWQELVSRGNEPSETLVPVVTMALPEAEKILRESGGPTADFTLHDGAHSYRVAELMAQLMGPDVLRQLGPHDLALLLLSGYLHDIGMTPPLAKLDGLLAFALSGDSSRLTEDDTSRFQAWFDNEWGHLGQPLSSKAPTAEEIQLARQVVAGYVRHRHVDWSAEWIEDYFGALAEPYPGWTDDLTSLCRSHHFGIDQLRSPAFNPRLVGSPATVIHLRYCACLLRVADVLDFDPERTPSIVFRHRGVSKSSEIFWRKDHELSFELENGHLTIHARPPDAVIHRAIELTIDDVNSELLLVRQLADETNFQYMPGRDRPLPHRWQMDTTVRSLVTPKDDSYEYIDGTFRPDPQRLLELVGGVELYGSQFAAVREILQNAFDAVREQIARERLLQPDPTDPEVAARIAASHQVTLRLEETTSGGFELSCSDSGSGMSRNIIKSRFLVGGIASNHDHRALERDCQEYGFSVGRTARFGIGVLSYFILGSHLTVCTRRSLEAGDPDGGGWTFTSDGLDDFGELRPLNGALKGTKVVLSLRPGALDRHPMGFPGGLFAYLVSTVKRAPCPFEFEAPGLACPAISSKAGWVDGQDLRGALVNSMFRDLGEAVVKPGLVPARRKSWARRQRERSAQVKRDGAELFEPRIFELVLPEGLGTARIAIGTFRLKPGTCFAYFDLTPERNGQFRMRSLPRGDFLKMPGSLTMTWNGMTVHAEEVGAPTKLVTSPEGVNVEVDWTSDMAGQLAVHRNSFKLSDNALSALEWLRDEVSSRLEEILQAEGGSTLGLLNRKLLGLPPEDSPLVWPVEIGREKIAVKEIASPAIVLPRYEDGDRSALCWKGSRVCAVRRLDIRGYYGVSNSTWHSDEIWPTALGVLRIGVEDKPVPVWESLDRRANAVPTPVCAVDFPPEWSPLAVIDPPADFSAGLREIWNANHPLIQSIDIGGWQWAEDLISAEVDPRSRSKELMKSPSRVASWILHCLTMESEAWEAIAEESPDFLANAWKHVPGLKGIEEIACWQTHEENITLLSYISPKGYEDFFEKEGDHEFGKRFPVPGEEWRITGWNDSAGARDKG